MNPITLRHDNGKIYADGEQITTLQASLLIMQLLGSIGAKHYTARRNRKTGQYHISMTLINQTEDNAALYSGRHGTTGRPVAFRRNGWKAKLAGQRIAGCADIVERNNE